MGVPIADVDDKRRQQQEDGNHDGSHDENAPVLVTHVEAPQENPHAELPPCPPGTSPPPGLVPP